jgi:glycosyltransferase involved in cell wall biosynthesis
MKETSDSNTSPAPLRRIYYVLETFPKLSETFIVEEISAFLNLGLNIHLVARNRGSFEVVHPAAQLLIDQNRVKFVDDASRLQAMKSLVRLFIRKPIHTARVSATALKANDRWRYVQALTFAADALTRKMQYIHAHFADENAWIASAIAEWTALPFGLTVHGYDVRYAPLPPKILSRIVSNAAAIVTVSEYFKAYAAQKLNIDPERIYVAPNGVDINRFSPPKHRVHNETCRLISVGRLERIKGHDILVKAAHLLKSQGADISLTLVGDGKERENLERQVNELELGNLVHFLGDQPPDSIVEQLHRSDIFVMPSRDESFGVACIEAMATGLPVVASRVGGLPAFVEQGINGLLFESEHPEQLAAAVAILLKDPEQRNHMGTNAIDTVRSKFSHEKTVRKLLGHLQRAADTH